MTGGDYNNDEATPNHCMNTLENHELRELYDKSHCDKEWLLLLSYRWQFTQIRVNNTKQQKQSQQH